MRPCHTERIDHNPGTPHAPQVTSTSSRRCDFLCDRSCLAEEIEPEPERHDQPGQMAFENAPYLFDRDEWRAEG